MADVCESKHGGNAESIQAYGDGKDSLRVYQAIVEAGDEGLTSDELAARWGVGLNTISGRFSDLKKDGVIRKTGKRPTRTGSQAGVYVVAS